MNLLNKISLCLATILLMSCKSTIKEDEYQIINVLQNTFIKPVIYPEYLNQNKIRLSQEDYDKANVLVLINPPSIDSTWYSKILLNNKFSYMLSDTLALPRVEDITVKMMTVVNGINLKKPSDIDRINFSLLKENKNITRINGEKNNAKGVIFIGKFKISRIFFDSNRINAFTEIIGIHKNSSGISKKDTTKLPILLKKENGEWKIKNL